VTQAQLYAFADRGWLHNLAPAVGTPANLDAASVGGGIRFGWQPAFAPYGGFSTDLSVAKGIDGPRDELGVLFHCDWTAVGDQTMRFRNVLLASTALLALGAGAVYAGPDGPVVVGGSASVSGAGTSSTVINQNTKSRHHQLEHLQHWRGRDHDFRAANSSSVALNRVTGGSALGVYGTLNANGYVFLINRDGVLVGPSGVINTAGFLPRPPTSLTPTSWRAATTSNIGGTANASIINQGNITATRRRLAALVAPGVRPTLAPLRQRWAPLRLPPATVHAYLYGDKLIQLSPTDQIAISDRRLDRQAAHLARHQTRASFRPMAAGSSFTAAAARAVVIQ